MGRKDKRKEIPPPNTSPIKPTILLKRTYMKTIPIQINPKNEPNEPSTSKINNHYGNRNRNNIVNKNVSLKKRVTVRIILCMFMCASSVVRDNATIGFHIEFSKIFTN